MNGELAKIRREVVEQQQYGALKFTIVETGECRSRVEHKNQTPMLHPDVGIQVVFLASMVDGVGGDCRKSNVQMLENRHPETEHPSAFL